MKKVLVITRTNWNEAPRIRHQITRLLASKGFEISYIEKNSYKNWLIKHRTQDGINFYSHAELIHHQLRYFRIIQESNNFVVRSYLKKILKHIEFDFILNFCYEYSFLKSLARGKKIITMIEDDFESQAKFGMRKAIRNQVARTCKNSDHILTVSYPLFEKLKKYNPDIRILFPWSAKRYAVPKRGLQRNTVLYFGYVHRLDWTVIEGLLVATKHLFRFVGPPGRSGDRKMVEYLRTNYANFQYIPFSKLDDLMLEDLFCSILPYDPNIQSVQACTISNRAFNLLSLGLPLVYANLPSLIDAPETVIRKNSSIEDYKASLAFFQENFDDVQKHIETFLSHHYAEDRWKTLEETINQPQTKGNQNAFLDPLKSQLI